MEQRYNVYFAGEVLEGQDAAAVRQRLGQLFKADSATLDRLFSGQLQLVKRDCDKATALKYQQAMKNAGARPVIRVAEAAAAAAPEPAPPTSAATAAERIAALAAAPDLTGYRSDAPATPPPAPPVDESGMTLAPEGTAVLREEERRAPETREIDTSGLVLDATAERLSEPGAPPPPAPETGHLSMGEPGDTIPTLPDRRPPASVDIAGIALSPEGTDFTDCAGPEAVAPDLDLSAIDLAPAGSDVLESQYRRREHATAPDTSHLALDD